MLQRPCARARHLDARCASIVGLISSALRPVTAPVGGHSCASDAPGGTVAPAPLEGGLGDLTAEFCSNSRARWRVELSFAAVCANAPICTANGKYCGSHHTPEFVLAGRPATSSIGESMRASSTGTRRSATGRRARSGSPKTESRALTFLHGGSATYPYSGRRRVRSRRYEGMSEYLRYTPRCVRTSRECALLIIPATVRDLEDLRRRHRVGRVARTPAYLPVRSGPRVRTVRSSRRVRTRR